MDFRSLINHMSKLTDFGDVAYDNILTKKDSLQNTFVPAAMAAC